MATKKTPEQIAAELETIRLTRDPVLRTSMVISFGIQDYMIATEAKCIDYKAEKLSTVNNYFGLFHDKFGYAWLIKGNVPFWERMDFELHPANPQAKSTSDSDIILGKKKDDVKEMGVSVREFMKSRQKSLNILESPKVDLETEEGIQQMESLLESAKKGLLEKRKAASKVSKVTGNQVELSPALQDILKAPKIDMDSLVKRVILEAAKMSLKK